MTGRLALGTMAHNNHNYKYEETTITITSPSTFARISKLSSLVAGITLSLLCLLILASIAMREIAAISIPDSFELAQHLMAVALCWGVVGITSDEAPITLDIFYVSTSTKTKQRLNTIMWATSSLVLSCLVLQIWIQIIDIKRIGLVTTELSWPIWPIYLFANTGLTIAALISTIKAFDNFPRTIGSKLAIKPS